MSTEVQTMAEFDDGGPIALRTPLYLFIALCGVAVAVAAFLPWAGVKAPAEGEIVSGARDGFVSSVSGLEAGGWGLSAIIAGVAIAAIGVLGYFWNPFSDPEAAFIAAFSGVAAIAALFKIADAASLFPAAGDFDGATASIRLGLWLIAGAAGLALLSSVWILMSRPRAEGRLIN